MIRPKIYEPHTIEDKIVRDGLTALSGTEDLFLTGGIALQLHLLLNHKAPSAIYRPTQDIDSGSMEFYDSHRFDEQFANVIGVKLANMGYLVMPHKNHHAYELQVKTPEDKELLLIHTNRFSKKEYEKQKPILQDMKNRTVPFDRGNWKLNLMSLEDIAALKTSRILQNAHKFGIHPPVDSKELFELKEKYMDNRKKLYDDIENVPPETISLQLAYLRSLKDYYDLISIGQIQKLNDNFELAFENCQMSSVAKGDAKLSKLLEEIKGIFRSQ